ncbi:MAG: hypothetical protein ACO2ZL_04615, partial [Flavobacteriales bacterium]
MRTAEFHFGGKKWNAGFSKLEREDVYGRSEVESFDSKGNPCTMATLVDGRHVLPSGSTSLLKLSPKGGVVSTSELVGMNEAGEFVPKEPSVYSGPVHLREGDLDDYLAMGVKSVYVLESDEDNPFSKDLSKGKVLQFRFNYREDYESDDAFLVGNGTDNFIVTGQIADLEFLYQQMLYNNEQE